LLRRLGAKEAEVSCLDGWSRKFVADVRYEHLLDADTKANYKYKENSEISSKWEFDSSGVKPEIPNGLILYNDEPSWKEIANGRLEGMLRKFDLNLTYSSDLEVNGNLKAKV
jgi:hypothetical protein